ncbi:M23 family metallopeptidase [Amaricoccus tamworthensis]|uniref:M23 family metallopeptidase n=1 Tax=Amaricoccus tamworthensis TaxID=57002 RepID=UPI003C798FBC
MKPLLAAIATALGLSWGPSAPAATAGDGREVYRLFLDGGFDTIWSQMTPEMRAALGSVRALSDVQADVLTRYGAEADLLTETTRPQGAHTVYLRTARWTTAPVPIQFIVTFTAKNRIAGLYVGEQLTPADSRFLDYQTKTSLRLPVEGEWYVYWGGRDIIDNYHAIDHGQRFAMDLIVMENGASHAGDPTRLTSYHCWNRPILAPADGTVVSTVTDAPDQPIGSTDPDNPAGNHVWIDFGNSEYGLFAHFRQGSVAVTPGERVTIGTELGRCGNSGNTSEPHLHFHLQTTPELGQGEGLPAFFVDYMADGQPVTRGEPKRGQTIRPMPADQ